MSHEVNESFPLDLIPQIMSESKEYRLLERIPYTTFDENTSYPIELAPAAGDEIPVVILDTETSGLHVAENQIIELAMVKLKYSKSLDQFTSITAVYDEFEQPVEPVSREITEITGITNEMLEGKHFDDNEVMAFLVDHPYIFAHNAGFDRPFVEKRFNVPMKALNLDMLPWGCTLKSLKWQELNPALVNRSLVLLAAQLGYFYDAHRAIVDCLALAWVLNIQPGALEMLFHLSGITAYDVVVYNPPFSMKDFFAKCSMKYYKSLHCYACTYVDKTKAFMARDTIVSEIARQINSYENNCEVKVLLSSPETRYKENSITCRS